jgi:pyruvate/2-oxoglutarate dehydrogenase complex dihydrolipoamide acyltransferase (E2) component
MIEIRVPKLYPTLGEKDWFSIEKWYINEGDIIQPGDLITSIECAPGFFNVPTPPSVQGPHRVVKIHVLAGSSTHLGALILTLEPVTPN